MSTICTHTASITLTELPEVIAGCQDCLAIGGTWVHLRMCQSCGRTSRESPVEVLCVGRGWQHSGR